MHRDLVVGAMAGDHDAFSELARVSIGRLYSVAQLILRDPGRAEDATQEALVAAWRDLSSLRDPDRFEAWLYRLLVRACYREVHRATRRRSIEVYVQPLDVSVPDRTSNLADRDQLERGFRQLQTEQRSLVVMHYYLGLTVPEAATVLGIPAGTAKSRLHRAMHDLRAALDADARTTPLNEGRPA